MIDSLTSENHRDFHARYTGTWGFFLTDTNRKVLVQVSHADHMSVRFHDVDGAEYVGYVDKGMRFEFIPINKGYFNGIDRTYWMARHPARQWHRGIHENNTICSMVTVKGDLRETSLRLALPEIFSEEHHVPVRDVFAQFSAKNRSTVALSKHFMLTESSCWLYRHQVGTREGDLLTVDKLVAQELRDTIRRENLPLRVQHD